MSGRVQALCAALVETYDGDVTLIWRDVGDGRELYSRLVALPGFGPQKAQIFTALLGKQRGVTPPGWREAAGGYGEDGVHKSVADVVDAASLSQGPRVQAGGEGGGEGGIRDRGGACRVRNRRRGRARKAEEPVHQVPTSRRGERIVDPNQVCDALAVLTDRPAVQRSRRRSRRARRPASALAPARAAPRG